MVGASKAKQKKGFDSPHQKVYLSLWRTYDRLRALEDALFGEWNLTAQQYNVLRLLQARHPEPIPTLQLSAKLISRAPDITRMLDKLEAQQWIRRERSLEDRRAVLVALTDQGLDLVSKLSEPVKRMHEAQLGHLTGDEMRSLVALLHAARSPHEQEESDWSS
jgi:DNA-binding MarR family transcriptional regulator